MRKISVLVLTLILCLVFTGSLFAYEPLVDDSDVDFGGATITYVGWWDPRAAFVEGGDRAGRLQEVMDRYNIGDVQFLSLAWGDPLREGMMNRLMNDESQYDIWCLPSNQAMAMVKNGAFYPVSDIVSDSYYDALLPDWKAITETFVSNGKKYATGLGAGSVQTELFMIWNKDIFERAGLPQLDEIYENGNWTYDKMVEIAQQATQDTNGDGELDQWGISEIDPAVWVFTNGAQFTKVNEDGDIVFALDEDPALYFLEQYKKWTQDSNYKKGNWQNKEFLAGQVAMAALPFWQLTDASFTDTVEFEYGVVPLPMGPNVDSYQFPSQQADTFYIPLNAKDPKGLLAFHSFLFRPEEEATTREETIIDAAPDKASYDAINQGFSEWSGQVYIMESILGPTWDGERALGGAINKVLYEGQSPASAMEAVKPQIQQILDESFND